MSSFPESTSESGLTPLIGNRKEEEDSKTYQVYSYRWIVLILFVFSGVANAMVLLTWAPITDKAQTYWDNINITAINLLSVVFQICYVPGTLLALTYSERYTLRELLLLGGFLTSLGCGFRVIGAAIIDSSASGSYALVFFGTIFVGLSQPFYLNMPAKIAATWFGVKERDIGTTLCSLANPLGSAIGSLIPAMFVSSDSIHNIKIGIENLLIVQLVVALVALAASFLFLKSEPISPPSASSAEMKIIKSSRELNTFQRDIQQLFQSREYVKLLFSFSIVLGNLNAIAALLNQVPGDYSNEDIGLTGAVLIMTGFVGAFATGFILDYSKAYTTVLKVAYILTFLSWTFFLSNCREGNFPLFVIGASLLGGSTLPTIPSTIVSSVECSFPIPEDASVGLLYMCANVTAIAMTFLGQVLLGLDSSAPAPFFPYGIFVLTLMFAAVIPVIFFKGKNFRLEKDTGGQA